MFTVRMKNDTPQTVELFGSLRATYGPDGEEAEQTYSLDEDEELSGKLLKGKSRSAGFSF